MRPTAGGRRGRAQATTGAATRPRPGQTWSTMARPTAWRSAGASNSATMRPRVITPIRSAIPRTSSRSSLIEYDRRAGVAGGDQPSVHGRASPHVEPAGRAMGDNNRRRAAELPRENKLLGVAAGQSSAIAATGCAHLAPRNPVTAASVARRMPARSISATDPNRPSWMKPIAKLSTIESLVARPKDWRSAGIEATPWRRRCRGVAAVIAAGADSARFLDRDSAAAWLPPADQRFSQLGLSVAADAGNSVNLAGADRKARIDERCVPSTVALASPVTRSLTSPGDLADRLGSTTFEPTISLVSSSAVVCRGSTVPTVLPPRMMVTRCANVLTSRSL